MLENEQFWRDDRRTGSIFILSTFGFLAGLAIVNRVILKGKRGGQNSMLELLHGCASLNRDEKGGDEGW